MSRGILKWRVKILETFENPEEKKIESAFFIKKNTLFGFGNKCADIKYRPYWKIMLKYLNLRFQLLHSGTKIPKYTKSKSMT